MKSGWPGVSMRLTVTSSIANDTTADLIGMPRCRWRASVSVWVLPSSTLPIWSMTPAAKRSRSVRVVLPASTCARIPKFSVCTKRHVLYEGTSDGHERCSHALLLGSEWNYPYESPAQQGFLGPQRALGNPTRSRAVNCFLVDKL